MPYVLRDRIVTLVFDKGPLLGLEVQVRADISLNAYFELQDLLNKAIDKKTGLESLVALYQRFAELALVGWDMTDPDGKPVPATAETLNGRLPPRSGMDLVARYIRLIGGVPVPLRRPSRNGRTSKVPKASASPSS